MALRRTGIFLFFLAAAWPKGARAEVVLEPVTAERFETHRVIEGVPHVLVGVGARQVMRSITIFGGGMYIGRDRGRQVWSRYERRRFRRFLSGGALDLGRLRRSAALRHYMVYGDFPKALEMRFARDTTATQCEREYRRWLGRSLGDLEAPPVRSVVGRFLADVARPMRQGDRSLFRTSSDRMWVTGPDGQTRSLRSRRLVHAFWQVYFGNPAVQESLRQGLLSQIERLHEGE